MYKAVENRKLLPHACNHWDLYGNFYYSLRGTYPAPIDLTPPSQRVDVWEIHLDSMVAAWEVLSADEQDRANKFVVPQHRHRFAAARSSLRVILGNYSGFSAGELSFEYGMKGKPALPRERNPLDLRFNVSHSGDLALIAVTCSRELGVDVEMRKRVADHEAIARRFFSQREYEALCQIPEGLREQAFLRCWTRKEAYIKALGEGLACSLKSFSVSVSPEISSDALLQVPVGYSYHLTDLDPSQECLAALAVEGGPLPISYFGIQSVDLGYAPSSSG